MTVTDIHVALDLLNRIEPFLTSSDALFVRRMIRWYENKVPGPGYIDTANENRIWLIVLRHSGKLSPLRRTHVATERRGDRASIGDFMIRLAREHVGSMSLRQRAAVLRATEVRS